MYDKFVGIKYYIRGVYGNVESLIAIPEENFNKDFDKEYNQYVEITKGTNKLGSPFVEFDVEMKDYNGDYFYHAEFVKGLPAFLGIDMGTYFKMAQLNRISHISSVLDSKLTIVDFNLKETRNALDITISDTNKILIDILNRLEDNK